jgi:hypothetical protein
MTDAEIIERLEAAGATLLALRMARIGPSEPRSGLPEPVREVSASYGWSKATPRPAVPCAAAIDAMDEALSWVQLIPPDRYVLRRIVNARALVSPTTQRHIYGWTAIARLIGADRKAVARWHAQGIGLIARALEHQAQQRGHGRRDRATPRAPVLHRALRQLVTPERLHLAAESAL